MARTAWTDKSLRQNKINRTFPDFEICAELPSVVYNGAWASISLISKEDEDGKKTCKAVFGHRIGSKVYTSSFEYEITKEEVNRMQIVCTKCGRVTEFHEKAIARLMKEKKFVNFNIRHFRLTVFGECKTCVRSRKRLGKK